MPVVVSAQRCPANHLCPAVKACPVEALTQEGDTGLPRVDPETCTSCGLCCDVCPMAALTLEEQTE